MHFPECARLDDGMSCRDRFRNLEVLRVGNANLATAGLEGFLIMKPVGKVILGLLDILSVGNGVFERIRLASLEDILFLLGNILENFRIEVEVLREYRLGRVC